MKKPVYLDYAATTPVDARVIARMNECLGMDGCFGNPASRSHLYGWLAEEAVENARRQVADLISADTREIVWTSGATESDNLAIKGAAQARKARGRHLVTAVTEHKAVVDSMRFLEREGYQVSWLSPGADGVIRADDVRAVLRPDTILVSIMHANNETGVINDIAAIGELCRERGVLFHVDAAQSAGKIVIDVRKLPVDLMSFSAHKIYGPKGVGALYVRRSPDVRIEAQMHGGGHERGMRSGTLPTHQLVGMGEAFAIAQQEMHEEAERLLALREALLEGLQQIGGVSLNGHPTQRLPGQLNVAFAGVDGEVLLTALSDIAVSSGSACTSASVEPSYVLRAMGIADTLAHASLRLSIGRFTTAEDIATAVSHVRATVARLRNRT
ncbi:MAG: IscS subfamily cysteine desulfurase [Alcanivoracaceae bacterium]|nr:IscS subfamily cysteine desulfurase [Alcanivoracaceae bacterium]